MLSQIDSVGTKKVANTKPTGYHKGVKFWIAKYKARPVIKSRLAAKNPYVVAKPCADFYGVKNMTCFELT